MIKAARRWKTVPAWVLGAVFKTEGSACRKAGAMMLVNSLGQQLGLLSGGCLRELGPSLAQYTTESRVDAAMLHPQPRAPRLSMAAAR